MIKRTLKKNLLSSLIQIRAAEETIVDVYSHQKIRTPTHLSIGQEAVAVGICAALKNGDQIFTSHRCHAAYLAKGGHLQKFFSELCGRRTGANQGRAGSAHLSDSQLGIFTSPILGGMIPVAAGAAFSFCIDKKSCVAVCFFGDAAIEEGAFFETLNFAVVKKLPLFLACENNLYSTHTHIRQRQPSSSIMKRIQIPELLAQRIDGNDVERVYISACQAVEVCRRRRGPVFLEFLTYRFREHVGPLYDYDQGYRTKKEVETWQKKCPLIQYKKKLLKQSIVTQKQIELMERKARQKSQAAYAQALKDLWPDLKTLTRWTY